MKCCFIALALQLHDRVEIEYRMVNVHRSDTMRGHIEMHSYSALRNFGFLVLYLGGGLEAFRDKIPLS